MASLKDFLKVGAVGVSAVVAAEYVATTDMYTKIATDVTKANPGVTGDALNAKIAKEQKIYRMLGGVGGAIVGAVLVVAVGGPINVPKVA